MEIEQASIAQELASLEERLRGFEKQYDLNSAEFYHRFRAGKLGDDADFFEWSAFYQMWLSTLERLNVLSQPFA